WVTQKASLPKSWILVAVGAVALTLVAGGVGWQLARRTAPERPAQRSAAGHADDPADVEARPKSTAGLTLVHPPIKRPLASIPWKRIANEPEAITLKPAEMPWKREAAELKFVALDRAKLPWLQDTDSVVPIYVDKAELPWNVFIGR